VFCGFEADYFGEGDEPGWTVVDKRRDVDFFPLQKVRTSQDLGGGGTRALSRSFRQVRLTSGKGQSIVSR
jgi:hypothetical protein